MKSSIIILIILVSCSTQTKSQENLGIKAEIGVSKITSNINELFSDGNDLKIAWAPSYNIGLIYSNQFSSKSIISVEAKFSQIQGEYIFNASLIDQNGMFIGQEDIKTSLRISYFSIPLSYGFKISKFTPSLGFRLNFLISDRVTYHESSILGYGETHDEIGTDQMDYGPQIGLAFNLNDKLAIEAFYYHGLNNVVNWDTGNYDLKWNNRQVTLGVNYTLGGK